VNRETAERCTILRGLVGSTVHGLNVNDGIEDRDEMGICVEPLEEAMALWAPFEQFIYRSAAEREGRENARSIAGDLDLTILLDVRRGKISEQECLTRAGELERELADLEATSALPEMPGEARVEEWVVDAYCRSWRQ
jgi:hypothetical protein